ncbi:MAG: ribonuclease P protein component [Gammaproteobacteria bacterium]|nr:ribonuclease P protein component [Gammaproteobacteria bacterium]MCP4090889.1 ribonuclease P protein component [Gammaproteobacteria bacterium]MCP4275176.1 ribonuclease P protein component [Gammaproteobacteria bacterium]MCP4830814.1 ribonuclease P protein component [Gammaproteobacteria bacterium]MCP4929603.1 ribonuclease P protein component [Gammaproteobacteria bacterium]
MTTPAEFARVFNRARRTSDRYFTVLYRDNDNVTARLGFAVAKKHIPAAVGRNRVRRIVRESFRKFRTELGSIDIIIMAQSPAISASNTELFASVEQHWEKLRLGEDKIRQPQRRSRNKRSTRKVSKDNKH